MAYFGNRSYDHGLRARSHRRNGSQEPGPHQPTRAALLLVPPLFFDGPGHAPIIAALNAWQRTLRCFG